jgi:hypothetical protein
MRIFVQDQASGPEGHANAEIESLKEIKDCMTTY